MNNFLKQQGFKEDLGIDIYFNKKRQTIMTREWVEDNPKEAKYEAISLNKTPKVFGNLTNQRKKELIKEFL